MKKLFLINPATILKNNRNDFGGLEFFPETIGNLVKIAAKSDFELGLLLTDEFLLTKEIYNFLLKTLRNEQVNFEKEYDLKSATKIDGKKYDLKNSYVISNFAADLQLAKKLGCKAISIKKNGKKENKEGDQFLVLKGWRRVYEFLYMPQRKVTHHRKTLETDIKIELNLDGKGRAKIKTGLSFFDHMLEQIAKHGNVDLTILAKGDLHVDEHHTVEDVALTLGEALAKAIGDKKSIERYGFCLPMDDSLAIIAVDFGGRPWLIWDAEFKREKVGDMPTELFFHFFKSLSDAAKINLNIKAVGKIEHHKIEAIFKTFAKALKMAIKRDPNNQNLPSTKGLL